MICLLLGECVPSEQEAQLQGTDFAAYSCYLTQQEHYYELSYISLWLGIYAQAFCEDM